MKKLFLKGMIRMNLELVKEIRTMPRTIENIANITEKIIEDLATNTFPIPIIKILKELDFLVISQKLEPTLGGYIAISNDIKKKYGNDKIVCINSDDQLGHQRFTLAHELAHYLFDFDDTMNEFFDTYDTRNEMNERERLANKFAANLLMPEKEFEKVYKSGKSIRDIQEYFEVSQTAVIRRICELNLVQV